MSGRWNGLRALAGDALVAVGTAIKGRSEFDELIAAGWVEAGYIDDDTPARQLPHPARMESDGPNAADAVPTLPYAATAADVADLVPDVREHDLYEFADSDLIRLAVYLIDGWAAILLRNHRGLTDVDVFVEALQDRANQFAAVEADADKPFLTTHDLTANLRAAADTFPQSRGK